MSATVLIVDDSLTVRMDLNEAFEAAGFGVQLCATAAEARDAIKQRRFSLVVLDVLLPDADGVELLAELRGAEATAALPVMLLSTEAEVRDRVRGLRTGADEYVGKPYNLTYVTARARELLRRATPEVTADAPVLVLVIDDSLTFREGMKRGLEASGYQVVTAASGEEGLRIAADLRPGAVIVDGVLPGIEGAAVVRRIRLDAALRRTPCILLTASEDRGVELRALDSGADAFVRKDEDIEVLRARLRAIVRRPSAPMGDAMQSLLGPKKILAVDDSATYLDELSTQLTREGYDVVLAHSGEEAIELLAVQAIDCILLDVMMPGLSGEEACRRIKAAPATRDVPLMMLTGREERGAMLDGINAGADDYVTKSSDFDVLRARLRAQLRRKQFEDENRDIREQLLRKELDRLEARAACELAETRALLLTDLENKNLELDGARRQLQEILDGTTAVIHLKDREGRYVFLNKRCQELFGRAKQEAVGRTDLELYSPAVAAALRANDALVLEEGTPHEIEEVVPHSDGPHTYLSLKFPLHDGDGTSYAVCCVSTDITERKREEEELRQAKLAADAANRELEAFSYSVAHDLRAPLRGINGYSRMLLEGSGDRLDDEGRRRLEGVQASAGRMGLLIEGLLGLSRMTRASLRRSPTDMTLMARATIARLERLDGERRHVDAVVADGLTADGDPTLLGVALDNLLGNAWKFTSKRADARIEVGAREDNGARTYFVRDNGAGFDMRYAKKLFGVFQRLHADDEFEGTGIGLATVERIVRKHGGRIWAEGAPGQGATFSFTLAEDD